MCFLKSRDASIGDAVPQLDAAVLAASHVHVGARVVINGTYGVRVLVLRVAGCLLYTSDAADDWLVV